MKLLNFGPLSKFRKVVEEDTVFKELNRAVEKVDRQITKNEETINQIEARERELEDTKLVLAKRNDKYKNAIDKLENLFS